MNKIHVVHLYPTEMNIYGDTGNRRVLEQRLRWRGFEPVIHLVGIGDKLPTETDFILGGGGQDSGQLVVVDDLAKKRKDLHAMADAGVTMLMICGMYQLFGHYFLTHKGKKLPGISIFNLATNASHTRLIGNITVNTEYGKIVGYENHSGLSELADNQPAFGRVPTGQGNNGRDKTEGALLHNVIGSYLHGPILSKNPHLADALIAKILARRGLELKLEPLDDSLEQKAAALARKRPR